MISVLLRSNKYSSDSTLHSEVETVVSDSTMRSTNCLFFCNTSLYIFRDRSTSHHESSRVVSIEGNELVSSSGMSSSRSRSSSSAARECEVSRFISFLEFTEALDVVEEIVNISSAIYHEENSLLTNRNLDTVLWFDYSLIIFILNKVKLTSNSFHLLIELSIILVTIVDVSSHLSDFVATLPSLDEVVTR